MNQFNATFIHLSQYYIVICKQCRLDMMTAHLASYLLSKHVYLTAKTWKKIIQTVQQKIQILMKREKNVIYSELKSESVSHLIVWQNRLKCTADKLNDMLCDYICCILKNIQKHCCDQHEWINTWKRSRMSKKQEEQQLKMRKMWIDDVHCQKFEKTEKLKKLFEIKAWQKTKQLACK